MKQTDGALLRLVPTENRIDINLSEHSFDVVRKLAASQNTPPKIFIREVITSYLCKHTEKIEPPIRYAWMDR